MNIYFSGSEKKTRKKKDENGDDESAKAKAERVRKIPVAVDVLEDVEMDVLDNKVEKEDDDDEDVQFKPQREQLNEFEQNRPGKWVVFRDNLIVRIVDLGINSFTVKKNIFCFLFFFGVALKRKQNKKKNQRHKKVKGGEGDWRKGQGLFFLLFLCLRGGGKEKTDNLF